MNRLTLNTLRGGVAVAALGLLGPLPGVVPSAQAWYGCPGGYELQTRNNGSQARCYRPRQRGARVQPDAGCPVGTTFNADNRGNTDYCLPVTGTIGPRAVPAACAPNQEVERRPGRDRCYQLISADEKPVTVNR